MEARFAELLAAYCLEAQSGETVLVEAETPALPLLPHLKRALLRRGAYPLIRLSYPGEERDFLLFGGRWLEEVPGAELALYQRADKFLRVLSAENPLEAAAVDPALALRRQRAWRLLQEIRLGKRWALTLYPTVGYAVGAGMGTEEFRAYLQRALFLDREDPVAAWQELSRFQEGLIRRLSAAKELRILAPGTDLRLSVAGRTWINSDGRRNMPSGEVFTGPVEDSAEGEVCFNLPAFVGEGGWRGCTSALPGARWWRPGRRRGRPTSKRPWPRTRGPGGLGRWASAPTSPWTGPRASSSWTRRWGAPSTWPWAGATRRRADGTKAPSTGTWSSP